MSKKKVVAARNLENVYQVYHSKQESKNRKSKFFMRGHPLFCVVK
jgi:hypothetical protein